MTRLDLGDIQGNVVRGYRFPVAEYIFIAVADAGAGQRWLRSMVDHVTDAQPWDEKPGWALNIAFTHSGLGALGMAGTSLESFPAEFRAGMRGSADVLGDRGSSSPSHWEPPFRD